MRFDPAKLREARAAAELSQRALAEVLDCRQATIAEWEAGAYEPSSSRLFALAGALKVQPSDLMG